MSNFFPRYFGKLPLPPMQCVPTQSVPLSHGPGSKFLSRARLTLHAIQCHLDNQGSSKLIVDLVIKSSTNSQVNCMPLATKAFKAHFIFVQHLRGFLRQYLHLEICVLSTPRQMPQTITNIPRCLPQILTVPEIWCHLAHSFCCKNVPFDFERAF